MFKLKFAKTCDNTIFTKFGIKPVVEDYFKLSNNIFCVADGVTRDLITGQHTPYPETKEEAQYIISSYPNPSGAFTSAKICCDRFIEYLKQENLENMNKDTILKIVSKVNDDIWEINKDRKINYLDEDLYCCEAAGGIILDNMLYCFSIGDTYITLLDSEYNNIFTSINNHEYFEKFENKYLSKWHFDWTNPKDRMLVRAAFRNNPLMKFDNEQISYGALSGEKESMEYVDVYNVALDNVKYICAYSDGCESNFRTRDSIKNLIEDENSIELSGKERTLVIYEKVLNVI